MLPVCELQSFAQTDLATVASLGLGRPHSMLGSTKEIWEKSDTGTRVLGEHMFPCDLILYHPVSHLRPTAKETRGYGFILWFPLEASKQQKDECVCVCVCACF